MIGIGQTLGNYRIVEKLGHGGMGVVWLAEHPLIGKRVALKVIHKDLSQNRDIVTRFWNEARAVNQIGNDHIVDISDFGQTDEGELFFIMELLAGQSLADLIDRERMTLPHTRALHIGAQIADALAASHAVGIIHRDLKPENVFLVNKLGDPDFVKILDFGLAKLVADQNALITQKGVILGTPEFMSPEQCESRGAIDHRSDIYSLGILMYQMMTCQLPFTGQSMGEVLVKQVTQSPRPPRGWNAQIPKSVEAIILRCLAKRPEDRFQHMAEVRAALLDPERYVQRNSGSFPLVAPAARPPGAAVMVAPPTAPTLLEMDVRASGNFPAIPQMPPPAIPTPRPVLGGMGEPNGMAGMNGMNGMRGGAIDERTAKKPRWPLAVAAVIILGGVGAAVFALGFGFGGASSSGSSASASTSPADPAKPRASLGDERAAPSPAAPVEPKPLSSVAGDAGDTPAITPLPDEVRIRVTTDPSGAEIWDQDSGQKLGVSPKDLHLPRTNNDHTLIFRHAGYEERKKIVHTSGDAEIALILDPLTPAEKPRPANRPVISKPPKTKWKPNDDSIMQPKF